MHFVGYKISYSLRDSVCRTVRSQVFENETNDRVNNELNNIYDIVNGVLAQVQFNKGIEAVEPKHGKGKENSRMSQTTFRSHSPAPPYVTEDGSMKSIVS